MNYRRGKALAVMVAAGLCVSMSAGTVYAGSINGNEAAVISAASQTFSYGGKSYRASAGHVSALRSQLAQDGVDLTAEQAQALISDMHANVATGVREGYLVEVGGQDGNGSDNSDGDKNGSGSDKTSGNKNETGSDKDGTDSDKTGSDKTSGDKNGNGSDKTSSDKNGSGNDKTGSNKNGTGSDKSGNDKNEAGSDKSSGNQNETGSDGSSGNQNKTGSDKSGGDKNGTSGNNSETDSDMTGGGNDGNQDTPAVLKQMRTAFQSAPLDALTSYRCSSTVQNAAAAVFFVLCVAALGLIGVRYSRAGMRRQGAYRTVRRIAGVGLGISIAAGVALFVYLLVLRTGVGNAGVFSRSVGNTDYVDVLTDSYSAMHAQLSQTFQHFLPVCAAGIFVPAGLLFCMYHRKYRALQHIHRAVIGGALAAAIASFFTQRQLAGMDVLAKEGACAKFLRDYFHAAASRGWLIILGTVCLWLVLLLIEKKLH